MRDTRDKYLDIPSFFNPLILAKIGPNGRILPRINNSLLQLPYETPYFGHLRS